MKKFLIAFLLIPSLAFGAASYPTSVKSFTTKVDNVDDVMAADINGLQDEVVAVETALGVGKSTSVIQVVNYQTGTRASGSTTIPQDNTIPQNNEGDEYMTLAITPKSSTNVLKVDVTGFFYKSGAAGNIVAVLFRDSTANAVACMSTYDAGGVANNIKFSYYVVAGSTSATTFKVRAGADTSGVVFNGQSAASYYGGVIASTITITEYKA